jgi:hypothetical protein
MGTRRGIAAFMRLHNHADVTGEMSVRVQGLLDDIGEGKHDESIFAWSEIGTKQAPTSSNQKEIGRFMEATIGYHLGTQHNIHNTACVMLVSSKLR